MNERDYALVHLSHCKCESASIGESAQAQRAGTSERHMAWDRVEGRTGRMGRVTHSQSFPRDSVPSDDEEQEVTCGVSE